MTPAQRTAAAVNYACLGIPARTVARRLRVSRLAVLHAARAAGYLLTSPDDERDLLELDYVVEAYRAGVRVRDICADRGIRDHKTLYKMLDAAGVPRRGEGHPTRRAPQLPQYFAQIVDAYESGKSANAVANKFGVDFGTVLNYARRAGVPIRPRGGSRGGRAAPDAATVARVAKMYAAGRTSAEVGERYNLSAQTVLKYVRRAGLAVRARGTYATEQEDA